MAKTYDFTKFAKDAWPSTVTYGGLTYWRTGKEGKVTGAQRGGKLGEPSMEYKNTDNNLDRRVWFTRSGALIPD